MMDHPSTLPTAIYKIATLDNFVAARKDGAYTGMPVDEADGYMHFSTASQLSETLKRHFAGQTGLVLLEVQTASLREALRWEASRGGELFPHLYASLPIAAIGRTASLDVADDGSAALPDWVR